MKDSNTRPRSKLLERVSEYENPAEELRVHISYQIIKLFSEGLYKSPHKAVEELVSNSYDAGADTVHILMNTDDPADSLWVIDNGTGMDSAGFRRLWTIAKSEKATAKTSDLDRQPIGQFGIGKLASYVLAQHLTHVSKTQESYLFTSMDFSNVSKKDIEESNPLTLSLNRVDEEQARQLLEDLISRYPDLESSLFGQNAWPSWTAAAMSSFKKLGQQLKEGMLKWVIKTGLPIATDFSVFVNGDLLESPQLRKTPLKELVVGGAQDSRAAQLKLEAHDDGVMVPGLGRISGKARIYKKPLSGSKAADQYHRNNGFFVFVRKRVINLEDELFGLQAQNHAAWSRFYMEVHADGLRDMLLSSREGVRDSDAVKTLREYMHKSFLECRQEFDKWKERDLRQLDIQVLLKEAPSLLVTEPLTQAVSEQASSMSDQFRYIRTPKFAPDGSDWLSSFEEEAGEKPFVSISLEPNGPYSDIVEYDASTRKVVVNSEHPFIVKVKEYSKGDHAAQLVGTVEVVAEALLHSVGVAPAIAYEFLNKKDEIFRLLAGEYPAAAMDALRFLDVANENDTAMERAVGTAFEVLGFDYEQRGENKGGTDGVLTARLGRGPDGMHTYRVVFDAKTTAKASVPAGKLGWEALNRFQQDEKAQHAFFLAKAYAAETDVDGAANREARSARKTLLKVSDIKRLVLLHMKHGTTLQELRSLFEKCYDRQSVNDWMMSYSKERSNPDNHVPLLDLLQALEEQKDDPKAEPDVNVARRIRPSLFRFEEDRLLAVLDGVEKIVSPRWLEVDEQRRKVRMHQKPEKLVAEVQRVLSLTLPSEADDG